jgi:hypothetical protein
MSEMALTGRQSRVGFIAEGKVSWGTLRANLEGDFLGVGTTSNDNQSTSYIFRQRIASAEAETNSHWTFSGGQGWTLATEDKVGITTAAANKALPSMIDPNYVAGLVWARMGYFRLTKSISARLPSPSRRRTRNCSTRPRWPATHPTPWWAAPA